jgi:quercetin dioxygenase-like cupin family protein
MREASPESVTGGQERLQALLASGDLRIAPKLTASVDGPREVTLLRVDLAPGVVEPHHTHPGLELLYGLAGSGAVEVDDAAEIPITPGSAVQVEAGQVKSLRNTSTQEPFSVLAVLLLEPGQPPLTITERRYEAVSPPSP